MMLARVPIRLRLTAGFTLVMAIVLLATGGFVYLRLASALDGTVDSGLRSRAQDVASLVQQSDSGLREASSAGTLEPGESYAQVLTPAGGVVDTTPQLGSAPLLDRGQLERAARRALLLEVGPVGATDNASRLLALPVVAQERRLIVVVGTSLESRDEALASLRTQLLIGGPSALLLAALAGYGLAAAALRPVAAMRRRAASMSGSRPAERLPLPKAHDEIRELGDTLNDMLARIETTIRRERRFIADASHEIRTPLSLLRTELELARWPQRTREQLERALQSASEEADRLSQLAEDLLVLARSDDGNLPVQHRPLRTHALLADAALRFEKRAEAAGRTIVADGHDLPLVGDRLRLEQALGNLIDNALRYGAGTVRLSAEPDGDQVRLHVYDDGTGFGEEFLPRAFERFTRADEARGRGGTGLGLAIVDVIARAHGGSSGAVNRQPHGADVWISLPSPGRSDPGRQLRGVISRSSNGCET